MDYRSIATILSSLREDIHRFINTELKKSGVEGMVCTHGAILYLLFKNDGRMAMKDIAEYLNKRKSSITDLVGKLIDQGYISKCDCHSDGRIVYAVLTEKAYEIKPKMDAVSRAFIEKTFHGFSDEEKNLLVSLLLKARKNFE